LQETGIANFCIRNWQYLSPEIERESDWDDYYDRQAKEAADADWAA